jgi:hypothetical protein
MTLPFGEERETMRDCRVGDWTPSALEGPAPNRTLRVEGQEPPNYEFTLVLHSSGRGNNWVWKRLA